VCSCNAIVGRWFTDFWGKTCDLGVVDTFRQNWSRHCELPPIRTSCRSASNARDDIQRCEVRAGQEITVLFRSTQEIEVTDME
jgi:hypothetical protein